MARADLYMNEQTPRNAACSRFARRSMDGFYRVKTDLKIEFRTPGKFILRTNGASQYLDKTESILEATVEG